MKRIRLRLVLLLSMCFISVSPGLSSAWFDETHIAIAKSTGYKKWFNATGADMAKLKAFIEKAEYLHGIFLIFGADRPPALEVPHDSISILWHQKAGQKPEALANQEEWPF